MPNRESLCCGCLFCRTNMEVRTASEIARNYPDLHPLVPMKERYRRTSKWTILEKVILFPGYIFFKASPDFPIHLLTQYANVLKVMRYDSKRWQLQGSDLEFAKYLYSINGVVRIAQAYFVGNQIRFSDGLLKDKCGKIIKVNKRAKTVLVSIQMMHSNMLVWVGYEMTDKA